MQRRAFVRSIVGIGFSSRDFERLGRGACDRADLDRVAAFVPEAPVDVHDEVAHLVVGFLEIRPWKQNDRENVVVAFLVAKGRYEMEGPPVPDADDLADLISEADRERPPPDVLRRRLIELLPH